MTAQNVSVREDRGGSAASRNNGPQNVLLLGVSFPDIKLTLEDRGVKESLLTHQDPTADQSVELVRRGILTEMDARDHARCVETEMAYDGQDIHVYTVSREVGGIYRKDRHIYANFNNSRTLCNQLGKSFGWNTKFQQVILDYYWMPTGWLVTRWAKSLFQNTLPDLVRHRLLDCSAAASSIENKNNDEEDRNDDKDKSVDDDDDDDDNSLSSSAPKVPAEMERGVVFLPFCAHVCKELVGAIKILRQYYTITFVKKSELAGHALWKGTMRIDGELMQHRLGKRLDQEEIYCTFNPTDILQGMEDSHIRKDDVMTMLYSIEDFDEIRMIRLKPLRRFSQQQSQECPDVPEKGGFVGLNWALGKKRLKEMRSRKKAQNVTVTVSHDDDSDESDEYDWTTEEAESESSSCYSSCDEDHLFLSGIDDDEENDDVFDPDDPENIPDLLQYYPYPALDLTSYTTPKDLMNVDNVMDDWAKTWGMKAGRKSKKIDMMRERYRDYERQRTEPLSCNERLPPKQQAGQEEEGYKWIWQEGHGWKTYLVGEAPDMDEEPRIVNRATQDYNMQMTRALFEMKNPGYAVWSRTFADGKHMTCYRIPRRSVLLKTHALQDDQETSEGAGHSRIESSSNPWEEKQESREIAESLLDLSTYIDKSKGILSIDRLSPKRIEKMTGLELRYYLEAYGEDNIPKLLVQRRKVLLKILGKYKANRKAENLEVTDRASSLAAILGKCESHDEDQRNGNSALECLLSVAEAEKAPSLLIEFADYASKRPETVSFEDDRFEVIATEDYLEHLPPFRCNAQLPHIKCNLRDHEDFPMELYRLLQQYKSLLGHIISWDEKGKSFKINDEAAFEHSILSQCDRYGNLESSHGERCLDIGTFKSTLRRFGFEEITEGPRIGGYHHDLFRRGEAKEVRHIQPMFIFGSSHHIDAPASDPPVRESSGTTNLKTRSASPLIGGDAESLENSESTEDEFPSPNIRAKKVKASSTKRKRPAKSSSLKLQSGAYNLSALKAFESELHRLLENAVVDGLDDAIRWDSDGNGFSCPDRDLFVEKVLRPFSELNTYKSFAAKCYMHGFAAPDGSFQKVGFKRSKMPFTQSKSPLAKSNAPPKKSTSSGAIANTTARSGGNNVDEFISTLYSLLMRAKSKGVESFMSWNSDGKSFTIHNPSLYDDCMRQHFPCILFETFKRKFTFYGFEKDGTFGTSVTLSHPSFVRGQKDQLKFIHENRKKRPSCVGDVTFPSRKRTKDRCKEKESSSEASRFSYQTGSALKETTSVEPKMRSTLTSAMARAPMTNDSCVEMGTPNKDGTARTSALVIDGSEIVQITPKAEISSAKSSPNIESYEDFAHYDPILLKETIVQPQKKRPGISFAVKLYNELMKAENCHLATFAVHGRCFFVHDVETFAVLVCRSKLSFLQSLRDYGFRQLNDGKDSDGYFYPLFLRHRPEHVKLMWRCMKFAKTPLRLLPGVIAPDFWSMPFVEERTSLSTEISSADVADSPNTKGSASSPSEVSEESEETTSNASEPSVDDIFGEDEVTLKPCEIGPDEAFQIQMKAEYLHSNGTARHGCL